MPAGEAADRVDGVPPAAELVGGSVGWTWRHRGVKLSKTLRGQRR